jgi:hypothetical protein
MSKILAFFQQHGLLPQNWTISAVFTAIYTIVVSGYTIYLLKLRFSDEENPPLESVDFYIGIIVILGLIILAFTFLFFFYMLKRPHKYAAFPKAAHTVNDLIRDGILEANTIGSNDKALRKLEMRVLKNVAEEVCHAFEKLTGLSCRACISGIDFNSNNKIKDGNVRVLIRDKDSQKQSGQYDIKPEHNPISENTSYLQIITGDHNRIFFCNNLPRLTKQGKYNSTSFKKYNNNDYKPGELEWFLPYKSAIVAPIWYLPDGDITTIDQLTSEEDYDNIEARFYGFLCVDCQYVNAFDPLKTVDLVGTFADSLCIFFHNMEKYRQELNK